MCCANRTKLDLFGAADRSRSPFCGRCGTPVGETAEAQMRERTHDAVVRRPLHNGRALQSRSPLRQGISLSEPLGFEHHPFGCRFSKPATPPQHEAKLEADIFVGQVRS